jgi:hypothetical protein
VSTDTPRTNARSQKRDAHRAHDCIDDEYAPWERAPVLGRVENQVRRDLRRHDRGDDAGRIACTGVPPDAAVEAERDEGQVADGQHDGDGDEEDVPLVRVAASLQAQVVRDGEGGGDEREVDDRLHEPARIHDERAEPATFFREARRPFRVGEPARKLDEQREREQHADQGHPGVVEHGVEEAGRSEGGGDHG